jgi:hypothetical protein
MAEHSPRDPDSLPDSSFAYIFQPFNFLFSEFMELVRTIAEQRTLLTPRNMYFVVEVIRNIAEYCVFGEKIGRSHMDTFVKVNCLNRFQQILA